MLRWISLIAALGVLSIAQPSAASVTIDFAGGNSPSSGAAGNIATYTGGGVAVLASGWSSGGSSIQSAFLGQYSDGLGVTNQAEGNGNAPGQDAIDNTSGNDGVLLVFDQPVSLLFATLIPVQHGNNQSDNDVTIAFANFAGTFALTSGSPLWSNLGSTAYSMPGNGNAPFSTLISSGANYANAWYVSADILGLDHSSDGFRLSKITVNTPAVPEPSSWAMGLLGFWAVGSRLRRTKSPAGRLAQLA